MLMAFVWLGSQAEEARALDLDAQRDLVNQGVIGVLGDGARGTDFEMIADLAAILDQGYDRRVLPMAGAGSVRAIEDLLLLRGVDVAFVQADVLNFYKRAELFPEIDEKVRYLSRLYDKEFHLLASEEISSIQDLEGRKVNFGPPPSGSFLTASLVFEALGIEVEASADDYQIALDKLLRGEIDAWVRVDAKPNLQLDDVALSAGVHLLSLPRSAIDATYMPATLTPSDYPKLIDDGEVVRTLAVATIMATFPWPKGHEKRAQLEDFRGSLIDQLDSLRQGPFHTKWQEVDPSAEIPGWRRF